jgi:hypothetical protein
MSHSEHEAAVRVDIVDIFVVESQWNTPAPAARPGYQAVCAKADMAWVSVQVVKTAFV